MTPSSTFLSLAGPGVPVSFSGEMGHPQTKCSSKPRKVFSSFCKKVLPLQRHSINGFNLKRRNSLLSFAFGKEASDNFFSVQFHIFATVVFSSISKLCVFSLDFEFHGK
jgi:hypothetical protein